MKCNGVLRLLKGSLGKERLGLAPGLGVGHAGKRPQVVWCHMWRSFLLVLVATERPCALQGSEVFTLLASSQGSHVGRRRETSRTDRQ